jgi:23S rRNA pseudouridine2605 synthase/16S rRNA pseudouridine516 synthase
MRLQKYLAECSIASRRGSEKLISEGRVTVNGETATVGLVIDPSHDTVQFDGKPVSSDQKIYVVLNKPKGVITSAKDTHHRKTVLDCIEGVTARIFPVGRLDMDVSGTLILTNDGELTHRLAHPSFEVNKVYHAWVRGTFSRKELEALASGVELEDGITSPAQVQVVQQKQSSSLIRLVIHEGRKRLVKRMCAAVGHPVRELNRVSIGSIKCNGLREGEWRYLSSNEVNQLKTLTDLGGN